MIYSKPSFYSEITGDESGGEGGEWGGGLECSL